MAAGIDNNVLIRANNPVLGPDSTSIAVTQNAVAGTAESITAELATQGIRESEILTLMFINPDGAATSIWLRDGVNILAGGTGGIEIPPGGNFTVGWRPGCAWLMENAHTVYIAILPDTE